MIKKREHKGIELAVARHEYFESVKTRRESHKEMKARIKNESDDAKRLVRSLKFTKLVQPPSAKGWT